jgi:Spy/CpxP family protein refolding chaperone
VTWRWVLALVLVAGVGVSGAAGQDGNAGRQRMPERRDEAFRMVDAYVIANIQDSLGLDDATYEKAIPVVNKLQKARRDFFHERSRTQRRMRRLLRSGTATEAQVRQLLDSFKALDIEGPERIRRHMDELDALLTPLQQAKYRVFEGEVEHRLRELMRRGRRNRSPHPE